MSKPWLHAAELAAYVLTTIGLLALAAYMVHLNRTGEALGSVIATVPVVIRAIGSIGQARVMNSMAEYLAKSSPAPHDGDDRA